MKIISVKTFPWEYTAVQIQKGEVKRCNSVCADCWVKIAKHIWKTLEDQAITARKWKCNLCEETKHIVNLRHYL